MKKNYLKLAVGLLPNMLLGVILAFMSLPISIAIKSPLTVIITSVLPTFLIYFLFYKNLWQQGWSDVNRVKMGQFEYDKYKGFIVGAMAIIPSFIIFIINLVFTNFVINIIFIVFNFNLITLKTVFPNTYSIIFFILIIITPVMSGIGYLVGYRRIEFMSKIIYKKQK